MKMVSSIISSVLIIIFGGILLGVVASILLGGPRGDAQQPESLYAGGAASEQYVISPAPPQSPDPDPDPDSDLGVDADTDEPDDPPPQEPPDPLLGRWDLAGTVEVAPEVEEGMATAMEFFDDGSGNAHHEDLLVPQDFGWETDSGRLTITPKSASLGVRVYEYEISGSLLTIFYNANRTSYAEYMK